ncbi:hypothetical protein L208DRAFT_931253 [Tricholoma matsutake]|nr:hypothetical protein L208DRAFT_931253 [Tricholoma matsutake 945]
MPPPAMNGREQQTRRWQTVEQQTLETANDRDDEDKWQGQQTAGTIASTNGRDRTTAPLTLATNVRWWAFFCFVFHLKIPLCALIITLL